MAWHDFQQAAQAILHMCTHWHMHASFLDYYFCLLT